MSDTQPRRLGGHLGRLLAALVAAAVCALGALVVVPAPAHAAPSGALQLKTGGSIYTGNDVVHFGIVPGTVRTVGVKVVNTASQREQFKIDLPTVSGGTSALLYVGSSAVDTPYYTPYIAPGGSLTLSVKFGAGRVPPGFYQTTLKLYDPDSNLLLDTSYLGAHVTYQTGSTSHDAFIKTGTQPYVSDHPSGGTETGTALKVGSSTTFKVRVQNNGLSTAAIRVSTYSLSFCNQFFPFTVKQGTTNVTNQVWNGTYTTGPLVPGAKKELTVTVKRSPSEYPTCTAHLPFYTTGPDGNSGVTAHVVPAA